MGEIKGVWKKLAQARMKLQESSLIMTGENKYSNYKYFELADFMPQLNKVNFEVGLVSLFNLKNDNQLAVLEIIDVEDGSSIVFETKSSECILKTKEGRMNPIQELGATHTYMRRYMYMGAYEISENDIVNGIDGVPINNNDKKAPNKKDDTPKLATQSQLGKIFATAGELKIGKTDLECVIFKDYAVKDMKELTTVQASKIIENIKSIAEGIEKRKEECIKAIDTLEMNEELITIMERDNIKNLPDSTFTVCKKVYKELKTIKEQKDKENKPEGTEGGEAK
ncbi:ERF family protein [Fusobacterium ulcerans]|uniref:ERF family protein n=1 Tax=Fusobacterium ulcerans TaxID=861 RepID=UPI0026F0280D|nr:ERF family protein [Fusobacterium ulcerans]